MIDELNFPEFVQDFVRLQDIKEAGPIRDAISNMLVSTCQFMEAQYKAQEADTAARQQLFQYRAEYIQRAREQKRDDPNLLHGVVEQQQEDTPGA